MRISILSRRLAWHWEGKFWTLFWMIGGSCIHSFGLGWQDTLGCLAFCIEINHFLPSQFATEMTVVVRRYCRDRAAAQEHAEANQQGGVYNQSCTCLVVIGVGTAVELGEDALTRRGLARRGLCNPRSFEGAAAIARLKKERSCDSARALNPPTQSLSPRRAQTCPTTTNTDSTATKT